MEAPETPARSSVVIRHVYNEEYLLPFWLEHHRQIFDHGVIIDHGSTDGSRDVVARMCPTWEVRPTRLPSFGAEATDAEVMDAEREFPGWIKAVLTVTKFLVCPVPLADLFAVHGPACLRLKTLAASGHRSSHPSAGQEDEPATLHDLLAGIQGVCDAAT